MIRFLRTIRFDETDTRVFEHAAPPGEWAVSGAFAFAGIAPDEITGKTRQAFAGGFLGLLSFGRSTFVTVGEIQPAELAAHEQALAGSFVAHYGAPDLAAALPVAREEIGFARELASGLALNTVLTVRRVLDGAGQIKEEFRTIRAPEGAKPHARIWTIENDGT